MRLSTTAALGSLLAVTLAGPALAAAGDLDTTFGGDGKVTTGFAGQAFAESVAIQDDGKILAAGRFNPDPGNGRFALVRYQPSGALDDTFGGDGKVTTGFAEDVGAAGVGVQAA